MPLTGTRTLVLFGLAVLVGGTLVGGVQGTAAARDLGPAACAVPQARLEGGLVARRQNGFDTDAGLVRSLLCADRSDLTRIGTPMTPAEEKELARRDTVGERLETINVRQMSVSPDGYVNSWIDPAAGGVATFAHVSDARVDKGAILASLPAGTPVAFVDGAVPLKVQRARTTAIKDSFSDLWTESVRILASTTDHKSGVLEVYIDPASSPVAETRLAKLLGPGGYHVKRVDPASLGAGPQDARTAPTGRAYGGIWISSSLGGCTASPSAKSAAGNYYVVTAGHCARPGTAWYMGNSLNTSYPLGTGQGNSVYTVPGPGQATDCDCQGIGPISSTRRTSVVLINNNAGYVYTTNAGEGTFYAGRTLCFAGAATYGNTGGIACGHMRTFTGQYTLTPNNVPTLLYDQVQTDVNTTFPGDSGGPYGDGPIWLGSHFGLVVCSGGSVCPAFSRASRVKLRLGISLQNLGY